MRESLLKKFLKIDVFGKPFEFRLPDQHMYFKSLPGAITTLFVFFSLFVYLLISFLELKDRSSYQIIKEIDPFGTPLDFKLSV